MRLRTAAAAVAVGIVGATATLYTSNVIEDGLDHPPSITVYEDGSWGLPDGQHGCIVGQLCDTEVQVFDDGSFLGRHGVARCLPDGFCEERQPAEYDALDSKGEQS